jgi:hypothetical protein
MAVPDRCNKNILEEKRGRRGGDGGGGHVGDRESRTIVDGNKGLKRKGVGEERVPEFDNMCVDTPVSRYQSPALGGLVATPTLVKAAYRALVSHFWAPSYVEEDPPGVAGF